MNIDVHFHCIPEDYVATLRQPGNAFGGTIARDAGGVERISYGHHASSPLADNFRDANRMIADMNEARIDLVALSAGPATFHYADSSQVGAIAARMCNDYISSLARAYPDRFFGVAAVPMQDVNLAIAELERAVKELGMRAVEIGTNVAGKNLDEPQFMPFFEAANRLNVAIIFHPVSPPGMERLSRYYLSNAIGFPLDTTICAASLIFGGLLEKLPELRLCFVHAGGNLPYTVGRLNHVYKVRPECKTIPRAPGEYFKLLYFDTITHGDTALSYLIETAPEHVVMGSDYPYDMADWSPVATVGRQSGLSADAREKLLGQNAAKFLKL